MRIGNPRITGLTDRGSLTGTHFQSGRVIGEEYRSKLIDPKSALDEFDQMRKVDPMVHATMVAITAPLLAADTFVQPSSKQPTKEEKAWADALNDNLQNELCCTWNGFLTHALLQYPFGFSLFEKVVKEDARGWLIEDLAPIMPRSVHKWVPANNGLIGIEQRAFDPGVHLVANPDLEGQLDGEEPEVERTEGGVRKIFIPTYKLVRFTHGQEGSNYAGRSVLQAAYRPYFLKSHAERYAMIALERQAVSIPIGKYPSKGTGADDVNALKTFLRNIRAHESAYGLIREDQSVDMLKMAGDSVMDPMPFITYWDQRIANLMLGMFIMTGQNGTGSRALMDPQLDIFMLTEEAGASNIASRVQRDLLQPLTELTHGEDFPVPEMVMRPRRTVRLEVIIDALYKLAGESGLVKPFPELTSHMLQAMDLPVPPERFQPDSTPTDPAEDPEEGGDPVPPEISGGGEGSGEPGSEDAVAPGPTLVDHVEPVKLDEPGAWRPARPLRGLEKFVAYAEIRQRTDTFEQRIADAVSAWSVAAGKAIGSTAATDPEGLDDVELPGVDDLTADIRKLLFEAFGFGRKTVAQERERQLRAGEFEHQVQLRDAQKNHDERLHLMHRALRSCHIRLDDKPAFVDSPADASRLVRQLARGLASWAAGRVTDAAMQGAVQAASSGLSGADAGAVVSAAVTNLSTRLTLDKVREFVRPAFAKGRAFEAEQLRDRIAGVAYYSDRADDNVCINCSTMDATFGVSAGGVKLGTKEYYAALPPNPTCKGRQKCRCTMVYG